MLDTTPAIQLHVLCAAGACLLGPIVLWRRRRDRWHKIMGYTWVVFMALTSLSSFAIFEIRLLGPFSPIHGLSIFVLFNLWRHVTAARQNRIMDHQKGMQQLYIWALLVAGLFTFLPGRVMNRTFFPDAPVTGFIILALLLGGFIIWLLRRPLPGRRP